MKQFFLFLTLVSCFVGGQYWYSYRSNSGIKTQMALNKIILEQAQIKANSYELSVHEDLIPKIYHKNLKKDAKACAKSLVNELKEGWAESNKQMYSYATAYTDYDSPHIEEIRRLPYRLEKNPLYELLMQDLEKKLANKFERELPRVIIKDLEERSMWFLEKFEAKLLAKKGRFRYIPDPNYLNDIHELRAINKIIPELFSDKLWTQDTLTCIKRIFGKNSTWQHDGILSYLSSAKKCNAAMMKLNGFPKTVEVEYRNKLEPCFELIVDSAIKNSADKLFDIAFRSERSEQYLSATNLERLTHDIFSGQPSSYSAQQLAKTLGVRGHVILLKSVLNEFDQLVSIKLQREAFAFALKEKIPLYVKLQHKNIAEKYAKVLWDEQPESFTKEKLEALLLSITSDQTQTAGISLSRAHLDAKEKYHQLFRFKSEIQHDESFSVAFNEAIIKQIDLELKSIAKDYAAIVLEQILEDKLTIEAAVDKLFGFKSDVLSKNHAIESKKEMLSGIFFQTVAVVSTERNGTHDQTNSQLQARLNFCARAREKSD